MQALLLGRGGRLGPDASVEIELLPARVQNLATPKLGFNLYPKEIGTREDAAQFLKAQLKLWNATTKQLNLLPE